MLKTRIDNLDKIFSEIVRRLAVYRVGGCEYCHKQTDYKSLQTSHFHGRRARNTRWELDNCAGLCPSCHFYLGEHPNRHAEWFKKRIGTERFEELDILAHKPVKVNRDILKDQLKAKLEQIKILEAK